jgi:hypothetical protein
MSMFEVSKTIENSFMEPRLTSDSLHTINVLDTNTNTGQRLLSSFSEVKKRRHSNSLLLVNCASRQNRVGAIAICDCGRSKRTLNIREQPLCLEDIAGGVNKVRSGRQILRSSSGKDSHGRVHGLDAAALDIKCCEYVSLVIKCFYSKLWSTHLP